MRTTIIYPLLIVTSIALLCCKNAFAVNAANGVVLDGHAGYANLDTPDKILNPLNSTPTSNSQDARVGNFSFGGGLGYDYALTNNILLGIDSAYNDDGDSHYKGKYPSLNSHYDTTLETYDASLAAKGEYLWHNGLNVFGKAGGAYVWQEQGDDGNGLFDSGKTNSEGVRPMVALGVGYNLQENLNFYTQYRHVFGDSLSRSDIINDNHKIAGINNFVLGLQYKFNFL